MFGEVLRAERERAGLSREGLRRRILRSFETAPSISAIRNLERGDAKGPQGGNLRKLFAVLSSLEEAVERAKRAGKLIETNRN